ncbi:MAG TPA: hypothetical protein PKV09_01620 [Syntrophales bacterium]|nr:hypothetical protein [Syntrophales bacterium]
MKAPPCRFDRMLGKMKMLSVEFRSDLKPEEIVERLKAYFERDLGLDVTEEKPGCLTFEGGGGFVTASICEDKKKTKVRIVTREWAQKVRDFVSRL